MERISQRFNEICEKRASERSAKGESDAVKDTDSAIKAGNGCCSFVLKDWVRLIIDHYSVGLTSGGRSAKPTFFYRDYPVFQGIQGFLVQRILFIAIGAVSCECMRRQKRQRPCKFER